MIDFRRSIPPQVPALHSYIADGLRALAASNDLGMTLRQSVARGSEHDRKAGAQFLRPRVGHEIEPSRVMVTNGTQNALLVLLQTLVGPNGVLVAERLSYGSLRAIARSANVKLIGLDIDDHGIIPASFEAACMRQRVSALYCNPTVQNPTAAVTTEQRRYELIAIARTYNVPIIEDDALGRVHIHAPPPIATLAPDITWYIMSTTKCLAQGLRVSYLVAPQHPSADQVISPVEHLSYWHAAPINAALVSHWINSGVADEITGIIAKECFAREALAREILGDRDIRTSPGSMHVWVKLPAAHNRHDFIAEAQQRGVQVRPSELFAVDDQPVPNAVRLALSPPENLDEVRRGLLIIRDILAPASISNRQEKAHAYGH